MEIPKCGNIRLCCIKCGIKIEAFNDHADAPANVGVWQEALVSLTFADHKSSLEGTGYILGVCVSCLKFAICDGDVHQFYSKYEPVHI